MTFEKILTDLTFDNMTAQQAYNQICQKDKLKVINYYTHIENITKEPLKDNTCSIELWLKNNLYLIQINSFSSSPEVAVFCTLDPFI